jgi:acetoin utilization deacetylase AcuC-like enzyme
MFFVHDDRHRLHFPQGELYGGELVTPFERPSRVEYVLRRLAETGFARAATGPLDMAPVRAIHDAGYLEFLETAWAEWVAEGFSGEIIAACWPARRMTQRVPNNIDGKVGYYALAAETAMTAGTWEAAKASCAVAQTAQRLVAGGERAAFALCRPPGHHAASDLYGGYCFINNAAVTAQMFRDGGAGKVAILDIDFHHGNGTQDIFYDRGDVFFASVHGEPQNAFPYFLGYGDEVGTGAGQGTTANYPLPAGTPYAVWAAALTDAIARIKAFGAEALVVSLGVDAFKDDPISFFKLESDDFTAAGRLIAGLGLPTVFVMEGGYAIEAVGVNTVNVLQGFEA